MEGIAKMEAEIKGVEEELTKETLIYNVNYAKNSEELTRRQNVLDVFQFILTFARCEEATSLLQKMNAVSANLTRICSTGPVLSGRDSRKRCDTAMLMLASFSS